MGGGRFELLPPFQLKVRDMLTSTSIVMSVSSDTAIAPSEGGEQQPCNWLMRKRKKWFGPITFEKAAPRTTRAARKQLPSISSSTLKKGSASL